MKVKFRNFTSIFVFLCVFIFSFGCAGKVSASTLEDEPIDVVIKYIDLTDKNLKRDGIPQIKKDYDNEELRYSLRSIVKNMPWARKIFIIMPNEKVRFLKDQHLINDKIVYIKDKDLLGFDSASSITFEFNLWKMEEFGCSKNFVYMNDDYFIGKPLKKSDFFYVENDKVVPYVIYDNDVGRGKNFEVFSLLYRLREQLNSGKNNAHSSEGFFYQLVSSINFLYGALGNNIITPADKYATYFPHNALGENIDELKEVYDLVEKKYKYADDCLRAKFRSNRALVHQTTYSFYLINKYERKINRLRGDYIDLSCANEANLNVPLFCINTGGNIDYNDADYARAKMAMNRAFPIPTKYERQDIESGTYIIESALQKNKVLDIEKSSIRNGANLQIWNRNNTNAQKFKVQYHKDKGYYTISPVCSGKCLEAKRIFKSERYNVMQFRNSGTKTQKWYLIPAGNGMFYISSVDNDLFVDVSLSNTKNGTNVQCWGPNGTAAQKFRFIKQ